MEKVITKGPGQDWWSNEISEKMGRINRKMNALDSMLGKGRICEEEYWRGVEKINYPENLRQETFVTKERMIAENARNYHLGYNIGKNNGIFEGLMIGACVVAIPTLIAMGIGYYESRKNK